MVLLTLAQISKQFEHKVILDSINCTIREGDRVAIIGQNGSGKSTLINILGGELEADSGERMPRQGLQILTLSQSQRFDPNISVYEVCEQSLSDLRHAHKRLSELERELVLSQDKILLEEQAEWIDFITQHNAWNLEEKVYEILHHFNLESLKNRRAISLSGGEQKRLALASILLKKADLFILDEPTNHLDVESVEFLEEQILSLKSSVVFISHDRYFIDRLAHRIIEVDSAKLTNFSGGYQNYLSAKEQILKNLSKEHENLLKLLKNEEAWLARGTQARRKRNEGRKARVLELRTKAKNNPSIIRKMALELQREQNNIPQNQPKNNKKMLFELENVGKKIEDKILIDSLNLRILQRDKIAIVGKNGSGKSTLLKMLIKQEKPSSGKISYGEISIGYFDQNKSMLDDNKTLLEIFCPNGGDHIEVYGKSMHVYGYLKNFLFPKEFLTQKIASLSGGEKSRVALALLFTKKYDCLILDEPTNDLDIQTINILEEHLRLFEGAVISVSHDRYFVDKIADKLLIFQGDGIVSESYASYSEYLDMQKEIAEYEELFEQMARPEDFEDEIKTPVKADKKASKLSYMESRELDLLPAEIQGLESRIKEIELMLSDPALYQAKGLLELSSELEELKDILEVKVSRYFELEEKRANL